MTYSNLFPALGFLFFMTLLLSCSVDYNPNELDGLNEVSENPFEKSYLEVDERLWVHFQNFEEEATLRNQEYDLVALEITGVISEIAESGVAGTCRYGRHIHHVTVDESYWNQASFMQREMVVFHELGHCVLARDHTESFNEQGICLSIMNSGLADCFVAYNSRNREAYINELFENLD